MKISRTWAYRPQRSQPLGARLGRPAVLGLAALAGLHLVWQFLFGSAVDVVGPARTVVNKSAVVSSFAQDFVSVWSATANDAAVLTGSWPPRTASGSCPLPPLWSSPPRRWWR